MSKFQSRRLQKKLRACARHDNCPMSAFVNAFEQGSCPDPAAPLTSALPQHGAGMSDAAKVGIIMGSTSDWETMRHAARVLDELGVPHETKVVSAHRTPQRLYDYATGAADRGLKVVIAGAGGAAHLPGMAASMTHLPVLGVPVESKALKGVDSLYSIVQMPGGVPVGTLAIGKPGAINAGLLAAAIIATSDDALADRLKAWRAAQTDNVATDPE
jgi:5-(carboxyamino)imidazole ribonucleotide mutase